MRTLLNGLVMAGGFSRRMGCDKALLDYHGLPQARWTAGLIAEFCDGVYFSCREGQDLGEGGDVTAQRIHDPEEGEGPIMGMLEADLRYPGCSWLVVACDLPELDRETLGNLLENRRKDKLVTAYRSYHDNLPEPLCAVYEPGAFRILRERYDSGCRCPRRVLIDLGDRVELLDPVNPHALDNANTPEEARSFRQSTETKPTL